MAIGTLLVANRGEIAVRVIRACRELGIRTVAVYSEADRFAAHTRAADIALPIGAAPARASYLNSGAILAAAQASGADAIHPGYGFLSENAEFAEACAGAGVIFIGPPPAAIRLMGSKTAAKAAVMAGDVPTIPGYMEGAQDAQTLSRAAEQIGYPVLIKAAAGGGGKGMRVVTSPAAFDEALAAAQREAQAAFGDATIFLEKLIVHARHIEFQILADTHGNCIHLGERECSIQRRHQKIVEESPSVALTAELRATMGAAAVRAAQAAGYVNAGTVEFLLDQAGKFAFLEMNTRLQVEHPITEEVMGVDLVHLQIAIAEGQPLALRQAAIAPRGHAIEVRLYAEDPVTYLPATGTLLAYDAPHGPGIRLDGGVAAGETVAVHYDPMLAKLIVTAADRTAAIARMRVALDDFGILGVTTNLPLLRQIVADGRFQSGATFTDFLEDAAYRQPNATAIKPADIAVLLVAAAAYHRSVAATEARRMRSPWAPGAMRSGRFAQRYLIGEQEYTVELRAAPATGGEMALIDGQPIALDPSVAGQPIAIEHQRASQRVLLRQGGHQRRCWAAMQPGGDLEVADARQSITVALPRPPDLDALAHGGGVVGAVGAITAPMAGTIVQVRVQAGDTVQAHQTLVVLGAMKMEHNVTAPENARVRRVLCREGDVVAGGAIVVELEAGEENRA